MCFKLAARAQGRLRGFPPGHPGYLSWHSRAWADYLEWRDAAGRFDATTVPTPGAVSELVSIVLPVYNGAQFLAEAIDSVLAQTHAQWELIIVDDGSTDASAAIAQTYTQRDPRIRLIQQSNKKLPAALNTGFAQARGEYLTWTSDDNRLRPQFLEAMAGELRRRPAVDMLYANYQLIGADGAPLRHAEFCAALQQPPGSGCVHVYRDPAALNLVNGNFIGPAFMFRARTLALVGGFDAHWFTAEDYGFAMRVNAELELRPAHFSAALYEYRLHAAALSAGDQTRRGLLVARLLVFDDFRRSLPPGQPLAPHAPRIPRQACAAEQLEFADAAEATQRHGFVSVIICTRRPPTQLGPVLQALAAQTLQAFELIIVDDRGSNARLRPSEDFNSALASHAPQLACNIIQTPAQGLARARNAGLRQARGEIAAYLDDDTLPEPDWLRQLTTIFAAHPACSVAGGAIAVRPPVPPPRWWRPQAARYWSQYQPVPGQPYAVSSWQQFPHGGNWAARRISLLRIGGFRAAFGHHGSRTGAGEEILAALQLQQCGGEIWIAPAARVAHAVARERFTLAQLWKNMLAGWRVRLRLEAALYIPRQTSFLGQLKDVAVYALAAVVRPRLNLFQRLERLCWAAVSAVLLWDFTKIQLGRLRRPKD